MNRWVWILGLAACVAGIWFFFSDPRRAAELPESAQTERNAPEAATAEGTLGHPAGAARLEGAEEGAADAAIGLTLTATEEEFFTMYEEIVMVFEREKSCFRMGRAIQEVIDAHRPAIDRLADERGEMSSAAIAARQRELEAAQYERMESMRGSVERAVARCRTNLQLRGALRELAAATVPKGSNAQPGAQ